MGYGDRTRPSKFFRRLIANGQPEDIVHAIERYKKDAEDAESRYLDLTLFTDGAFSYQDIMTMPIDAIHLLIKRLNKKTEDHNNAMKKR